MRLVFCDYFGCFDVIYFWYLDVYYYDIWLFVFDCVDCFYIVFCLCDDGDFWVV